MRVLKEVPWWYILMEDGGALYLTFMSGGPVEIDFCVQLTPAEWQRIQGADTAIDGPTIEAIIWELLSDREELHRRRIVPSKWPGRATGGRGGQPSDGSSGVS